MSEINNIWHMLKVDAGILRHGALKWRNSIIIFVLKRISSFSSGMGEGVLILWLGRMARSEGDSGGEG
jgi:hypothetical protein